MDVADFDAGREVEQCLGKLLHVVRGHPRSAETDINFCRRQILRLDGFERLDVLAKALVGDGGSVGDDELFADVAGEILIVGFPLVRLRIQKNDPFQVGQEFLDRLVQEAGHVVELHAAVFVQGDEQRLFWGIDRLNGLAAVNRAFPKNCGFSRPLRFVVVILEGQ